MHFGGSQQTAKSLQPCRVAAPLDRQKTFRLTETINHLEQRIAPPVRSTRNRRSISVQFSGW